MRISLLKISNEFINVQASSRLSWTMPSFHVRLHHPVRVRFKLIESYPYDDFGRNWNDTARDGVRYFGKNGHQITEKRKQLFRLIDLLKNVIVGCILAFTFVIHLWESMLCANDGEWNLDQDWCIHPFKKFLLSKFRLGSFPDNTTKTVRTSIFLVWATIRLKPKSHLVPFFQEGWMLLVHSHELVRAQYNANLENTAFPCHSSQFLDSIIK